MVESKRTKEVPFKPSRERDNALMTHTPYLATILDKFARSLLSVISISDCDCLLMRLQEGELPFVSEGLKEFQSARAIFFIVGGATYEEAKIVDPAGHLVAVGGG